MSSFPGSPRLVKGGIVLIDPDTSAIVRMIVFDYNPDRLTRAPQAESVIQRVRQAPETLELQGPVISDDSPGLRIRSGQR